MKKSLIALIVLSAFSMAAVKVQAQAGSTGVGFGAGVGKSVVPMILELGVEGSVANLPPVKQTGEYKDEDTGITVPLEGTLSLNMTRLGGYAKFTFPGVGLIPIVGMLAQPVIHFGTQQGSVNVDGTARLLGQGAAFGDNVAVAGSYLMIGFPAYIGPVFIEPAIGTQHIAVNGVGTYSNLPDAQISVGVSF